MPVLVALQFVWDRRTRSHQAHLPTQHVEELWELIQARTAQESSDTRDPWVPVEFVGTAVVVAETLTSHQAFDRLAVDALVAVVMHGAKFQAGKQLATLADALLAKQHRSATIKRDCNGNERKERRQHENPYQTADHIDDTLTGDLQGQRWSTRFRINRINRPLHSRPH
jgi:hypothetical protein